MIYTLTKSKQKTSDNLYIYNFQQIPQEKNYIKIYNLFFENDEQAKSKVASLLMTTNFTLKIKSK